jgi:lipid II:glycine glycyltransferase (peptidoglycan interpeptide bridge formation enzyme)
MDIKEELDKEAFNKVSIHPLQSWEWGEFRKKWGNEVVRLPYGQLTLHKIPFSPFKIGMFIKGPAPTKKMLDELKLLAKKERLIFIKLEPNIVKNEKLITLLKRSGAVKGKTLFTPSTFWIDLTVSEEELLASFHPKTRYNIRVAQKNGVSVVEDNGKEAFEKYLDLTRETVSRQGFYAHTERYHRLMWETLNPAGIAKLLTARYKGEIIACWIVFVWKNFLYYPYGASTEKYKNVMANNLMMWEAIRFGKSLGLTTFDLWGREEGKGFTRFKEGFSPKVVEFLGTWDLVTSPFYRLYIFSEYIRWIILRAKGKFIKPTF